MTNKEENRTMDLYDTAIDEIIEASKGSTWIPKEYSVNEILSDISEFLRTGKGIKDKQINEDSDGPIHIDFTDILYDLPIRKLVLVANLAVNKLTMRDIGEIGYYSDLDFRFTFVDKEESQ